ncbi:MAG: EAL domain-containing protein [Burkholderiaceae bacterium]|nr:EAL domain-containing protein [Burkholderiaceae bacterium]
MAYSSRLIAVVLFLNLAVITSVGLVLTKSHSNHLQIATTAVENLSELLIHDIGATYASTDEVLQELVVEHALELERGKPDDMAISRHVARQLVRHPNLHGISVVGPDGIPRDQSTSTQLTKDRSFASSPNFMHHQRTGDAALFVSEPMRGRISAQTVISLSRQLVNGDGEFDGMVVAELGLDTFQPQFARLKIGAKGSISLRDAELRPILRYPSLPELKNGKKPQLSADFKAALAQSPLVGTYVSGATSIDGVRRIHSYKRHPDFPVYLNVGVSTDDAFGGWYSELLLICTGCLIFVLTTGTGTLALLQHHRRETLAKDALAKSEARLVRAELGSKSGNWELHLATQVIRPSEGAAQIYGLSEKDFQLATAQAMVLPAFRPAMDKALKRLIENNEPYAVEFQIMLSATGEVKDIFSKAELDRSRGIVFGLIQDITQRKADQKALTQSEESLRLLANNATDVIWTLDTEGRVTYISPSVARLRGYTPDEIIGKTFIEDISASSLNPVLKRFTLAVNALKSGEQVSDYHAELEYPCKDGSTVWVETTASAMHSAAGDFVGFVGVSRNITEKRQDRERLRMAARVIEHAREGIVITDAVGDMIEVNDAFVRITGYERAEVLGRNPRILKSGRQSTSFYQCMWEEINSKGHWSGEVWNRRKNGEVYAALQTVIALTDGTGAVSQYVSLFSDITPMKAHQQQLEHLAQFDPLTDLPNRVLLADRLQQAIAQAARHKQSLAVAYLDLDGFKQINDAKGHGIGDSFLIALSRRMNAALREADTFARVGGDEFVAVLVDLPTPNDGDPVLRRLLDAAASEIEVDGHRLQVSASIGVTIYPQDAVVADQLVRHADQAMYQAKQAGKNRYHLFDVMQDAALNAQRESLDNIRHALACGEFVLHYQPKVNMRSGAVVGAEALVRWQHPERGLLPPSAFLPVIENDPTGIDLGEWVIEAVLTQMEAWAAQGQHLPVSVNLSAYQLQHANFTERLGELLSRHPQTPPKWLELEILETSALNDLSEIANVIKDCTELGVSFALDDFGTGYSSLTYLKHLRVGMLKIDQSFVRDMMDDPEDRAIVDGVIRLSNAFHLNVIAEGVETAAHGAMLLGLGCELAQGYGVARPMPADLIPGWIHSWAPDPIWQATHPGTHRFT